MSQTLIIVVGGDYLALEICKEILKTAGHRAVLLWKHRDERAARMLAGAIETLNEAYPHTFRFVNEDPIDPGALERAGLRAPADRTAVDTGYCVVAVSQDDRLNLRVALLARDVNDRVRVTLRQFNPLLGRKIQEGLQANCTAISPAAHAAATYAACAVDPSCFYALPFPTLESMVARAAHRRDRGADARGEEEASLFGFCERDAAQFGIEGMTIAAAEARLGARVVAVSGATPYLCHGDEDHADRELLARPLAPADRVVAFGPIRALKEAGPASQRLRKKAESPIVWMIEALRGLRHTEPVLRRAAAASAVLFVAFVAFFSLLMHWNVPASMYFVLASMATVGYGDITPCVNCATGPITVAQAVPLFGAMLMMIVGLMLFAVLTASITSALNALATRRIRGLRRLRRSNHVIVCGAGNVGMLVIDYLTQLGEQIVVVEQNPDNVLVEMARDHKLDLLTGDATNDETINYCGPEWAKSLVGVTNSDTANLEAALGARSRTIDGGGPPLHVILRIDDLAFGHSIERHFGIASFSTTELTAPTIAGLARFESTRGRFDLFAGSPRRRTFQLAERFQAPSNEPPPAPPERPGYRVRWVPLYAWRDDGQGKGVAVPIHKFAGEVQSGDRLLFMVPLDQFSE